MEIVFALLLVLLIFYIGSWLAYIQGRTSIVEMFSIGILLGTFVFTVLQTLLLQYADVPISLNTTFIILSCLVYLTLFYVKNFFLIVITSAKDFLLNLKRLGLFNRIIVTSIVLLILNSFIQNYFWPITDWDALALYDFRARVVAEEGNFDKGIELGYFYQYPPYTSLLHTILYQAGFERVKIWYSFLYISLLLSFYSLLRKRTSLTLSLIGTLALAVNPLIQEHSIMAYTNLAFSIYLGIGLLYFIQWFYSKSWRDLLLGSILISGSTWIRTTEPFWIIPLLMLISICFYSVFIRRSFKTVISSVVGSGIILYINGSWLEFVSQLSAQHLDPTTIPMVETNIIQPTFSTTQLPLVGPYIKYFQIIQQYDFLVLIHRVAEVSTYFNSFILPVFSIYILPAAIFGFIDIQKRRISELPIYALLFVYWCFIFIGTYTFSFLDTSWSAIGGSANRMSMFLIPLWLYAVFSSKSLYIWQQRINT